MAADLCAQFSLQFSSDLRLSGRPTSSLSSATSEESMPSSDFQSECMNYVAVRVLRCIIIIFFSSNSRNQNGKMLILRMSLSELLPE